MTHPLGNRGSGGTATRKDVDDAPCTGVGINTRGSPSGLRPSWLERWDEEPDEEDLWRERGWV